MFAVVFINFICDNDGALMNCVTKLELLDELEFYFCGVKVAQILISSMNI